MRRDGKRTQIHPRDGLLYESQSPGWDKWKKRVARRQRHYAIRIIKSRLTRRERGRRNRALMQVYALHYALRREKNVVTALNVRRLISLTLLIYNKS